MRLSSQISRVPPADVDDGAEDGADEAGDVTADEGVVVGEADPEAEREADAEVEEVDAGDGEDCVAAWEAGAVAGGARWQPASVAAANVLSRAPKTRRVTGTVGAEGLRRTDGAESIPSREQTRDGWQTYSIGEAGRPRRLFVTTTHTWRKIDIFGVSRQVDRDRNNRRSGWPELSWRAVASSRAA